MSVRINSTILLKVSVTKFLSVLIDAKFTWVNHMEVVKRKMSGANWFNVYNNNTIIRFMRNVIYLFYLIYTAI